jgi:hypothetical protein
MNEQNKLVKEVESKRTYFKTDSYPMSIGELYNLYEQGEIVIRPEYQRLFRWTQGQKVKLIESVLLGIPIPAIFVFQDDKGIWELVDGLQRVSTVLQFMGVLKDEEKLILNGTKYLPTLDGFVWESKDGKEKELPSALKLAFKRAKFNFNIILSESDKRAKFEIFQRLNTGGSNASNQEVRNSLMVMHNPEIFEWTKSLAENQNYLNTISITDRLLDEQYQMELVLRYIGLLEYTYDNKKDLGDYLDDINEEIIMNTKFNFKEVKERFEKTFDFLNRTLGEKSFKKHDGSDFKGKFLESAFESVAVGLAFNIDQYVKNKDEALLEKKAQELYKQDTYLKLSGSGSNAKVRIPKLIPFAKDYFKK